MRRIEAPAVPASTSPTSATSPQFGQDVVYGQMCELRSDVRSMTMELRAMVKNQAEMISVMKEMRDRVAENSDVVEAAMHETVRLDERGKDVVEQVKEARDKIQERTEQEERLRGDSPA